jgi:hypothetical protein
MKKILLTFLIFTIYHTHAQEKGTAKVRRVDGLDVYLYCEPLAEYDVLDKVTAFWNWGADEYGRSSIDDVVRTMIKRARKKNKNFDKKGESTAEGIIIDDNDDGVMIRYRRTKTVAIERTDYVDKPTEKLSTEVRNVNPKEENTPSLSMLQKKMQLQQKLSIGSTVLFDYYSRAYQGIVTNVRGNLLTIEYKDERGKLKTTTRHIDKVEPQ